MTIPLANNWGAVGDPCWWPLTYFDVAVALAAAAAKEEAGAFNGVSYAACGAHLGGHPNWKPRTAGTRQISSPICVSVPREVARTVFGTGPTST